ncbi:MAG: HD domain-containing protein [Terracidiphilus sp.]|nr:HD domain-containing protein [Terracidiphilus sp.]MDR3776616.1 HD domain-containing protein [Terracidiphilus sp.]
MTDITSEPNANEHLSLFALSWSYAQDGKFAMDAATGLVTDVNPAAVSLTGYSREELIGMHVTMLHPEAERERVKIEFRKAAEHASPHPGFHIQRKDGSLVPVAIWSSESVLLGCCPQVICEFRDITEEERKEHLLSVQNWALSAFSIAALALGHARSTEGLLQSICEAITRESAYVLAWIGIAEDNPGKTVRIAASAGSAVEYLHGMHLSWAADNPMGQGPTGICVRTHALQIMEDAETSPVFGPWRERARQFGIRSSFSIPIQIEGSWSGVLVVYARRPRAFEASPVEVFQRLAEQIVHGVKALEQKELLDAERQRRESTQKHLTEALSASVAAIVTAMEMRDPYTAGHESRVAEIAYAIGKEMGWNEDHLQGLRMAAMVHDIGKIAIPIEILTKPAKLSQEEYTLIKGHPQAGYAILKDIPFTWPVADIVRQHHEKLNGSGYPQGLKEDAILPESRVLAVADIVEAMASNRPYRLAIDLAAVLEEIESMAGTLLDAEAVRICVALFREHRLDLHGLGQD